MNVEYFSPLCAYLRLPWRYNVSAIRPGNCDYLIQQSPQSTAVPYPLSLTLVRICQAKRHISVAVAGENRRGLNIMREHRDATYAATFPRSSPRDSDLGSVSRVRNRAAVCLFALASVITWLAVGRFSVIAAFYHPGRDHQRGNSACCLGFQGQCGPRPTKNRRTGTGSRIFDENLATIGKNPYFNLEPGYRLRYASGEATRTMMVRRKTKVIDGVETRVVEEKEEQHGRHRPRSFGDTTPSTR